MNLQSDITTIKGVGEKSATLFAKLNIRTVKDLLFFFPRDYETFTEPVLISEAKPGELVTIRGIVMLAPTVTRVKHLSILKVKVRDASGAVTLTFFNMPFLQKALKPGQFMLFRGRLKNNKQMEQPRMFKEEEYRELMAFIQPKYPVTKGITSKNISKAVKQVLSLCPMPEEFLPEEILKKEELMPYGEALAQIHFPENRESLVRARKRLVFDEFFLFILMMQQSKMLTEKEKNTCPMVETAECVRFLERLPYKLTGAQNKVIGEILADMTGDAVMSRLVQGDVGSGKTIVAFWALLLCVTNGYQGALMAPTEVLARQHYEEILRLTKEQNLPFVPVFLSGSQTAAAKREVYRQIEDGSANLVIGTHAVIQDKVHFKKLALVVTDEQHRFGVRQRETLKEKGNHPHVLVMSATPIPRTLAIILYGDLQVSVIDELPGGRIPIKNCVVGEEYRPKAYAFMEKQIAEGRQVYCICPMVEEGETTDLENVADYTEKLKAYFPESVRIARLHGKMKPAEKNRIMEEFAAGNIDILVSTTVIEVGINVPNATVMMVENAERFGLAQLHQLRGRVGRGGFQSYCIFLNTGNSDATRKRLDILNHSNDGFYIANEDLKMRGPGELTGIRQSGAFRFRLGDIYEDADVLKQAAVCVDSHTDIWQSEAFQKKLPSKSEDGLFYLIDFTSI